MDARHLDWEGCVNVRDLGGLPTRDGRVTAPGALVRADTVQGLTESGWAALEAHGIRTVIDLRNEDELGSDAARRPGSIDTVHCPLDGIEDREFWDVWQSGPQFGTPLYYGPHLERMPQRSAAALAAIARARPGGVVVHCVGGRDRTGQVTMLALALAGVEPGVIAADYVLSEERLRPLFAARGEPDPAPAHRAYLAERGLTAERVIADLLSGLDLRALLASGGLAAADADALRARLLGLGANTAPM